MEKKNLMFILVAMGLLLIIGGCAPSRYQLANKAYVKGDYKTAQDEYSYLTEGEPGKPETKEEVKKLVCRSIHLGNHGVSAYYGHDYEEAARILEMCITYNKYLKGFVEETLKAEMARKYRFTPWEEKMIHLYLGRIYEQLGNRERSLIEYLNINESEDRTFNIAHYRLGSIYHIKGQIDDALVAYKNVLEVNRQLKSENEKYGIEPFFYANLDMGFIYTSKGEDWKSEAKKYFGEYISMDSEAINAKTADYYLGTGKNVLKDLGVIYIVMDVPYYSKSAYAQVYVNDKYYGRTYVLEDLVEHKERYEWQLKKVVKGVAKEAVGYVAREATIEAAGWACPCLGFLVKQKLKGEKEPGVPRQFDKWPSVVCVSKIYVDPGRHTVEFNFKDPEHPKLGSGCMGPTPNPYIKGDNAMAKFDFEVGKGDLVFVNYNPTEWLYKNLKPASGW